MLGSRSLSSFLCSLTLPLLPSPFCLLLPHPSVHTFGAALVPFLSHRQGHTESSKVNKNHFNTQTKQKNPVFLKIDGQDCDSLDQQFSAGGDGKVGAEAGAGCQREWEYTAKGKSRGSQGKR